MESPQNPIPILPPPSVEGRFAVKGLLLAILVAPAFGLVWAWVAEVAQAYAAPILLFPILLGLFAGLSIVGLVRFAQIGHRRTILLAVVLAAAVAAVGQHYFGYLAAYREAGASMNTSTVNAPNLSALLREIRPSFGAYMQAQARRGRPLLANYVAQGWIAWLSWAIDALLGIAAAIAVALPAVRIPYCNRCGTWYRIIRSGKIDLPTARRLAGLSGVEEVNHPRSPRYRLWACQGGCGPTRFELSWEETNATVDLVSVWLDASGRNQVAAILDGLEGG
jgi:hypothetical protein